MDDLLRDFLAETTERMDLVDEDLVALESEPDNKAVLDNLFRMVHTIKGTCSFLGLSDLATLAHGSEGELARIRDGRTAATAESIASILSSIDQMKDILTALETHGSEATDPAYFAPIKTAWQSLPRLVENLERGLDKRIELSLTSGDISVERRILGHIKDPLLHLINNAADHGLESREERLKASKSEQGRVSVSAYLHGDRVVIEVSDDGRGLPVEKIAKLVVEQGFVTEVALEQMSKEDIQRLIFKAGVSTAKEVTEVSGRGVGLDVVRTTVEAVGGTVDVQTRKGEGCTFVMSLPVAVSPFRKTGLTWTSDDTSAAED